MVCDAMHRFTTYTVYSTTGNVMSDRGVRIAVTVTVPCYAQQTRVNTATTTVDFPKEDLHLVRMRVGVCDCGGAQARAYSFGVLMRENERRGERTMDR